MGHSISALIITCLCIICFVHAEPNQLTSQEQENVSIILKSSSPLKQNQFKKTTNKIKYNDRRFAFLMKPPLPLSRPHYTATEFYVKRLLNATKYDASVAFALDAFSEYRIGVLAWMYGIRESSLDMCKKSKKAPVMVLSTVVYSVFNKIQDRLDRIHERTMKTFEISSKRLFTGRRMSVKQVNQKAQQMLIQLKRRLQQYETTIRKTKGILRSALSFL
ncbi:uncharacterized protein LOC116341238 [Contarinia nasturtii]|uniref:uncharacterized protein LOC116341238 n=1 Tax=Contarinia nasturtii TaxID=265458 RepID=UPI0012D42657|nr:uncharacterized protein LOC116341238 [Contarinia nasturtii]